MKKELQLYIHIPFCKSKCQYCDFLSFPSDEETMRKYCEMLVREISEEETEGESVTSVFFGGGTPSILPPELIHDILEICRDKYRFDADAEITIEMNPGTLSQEKLEIYKQAGINRLSIGLQSANNAELKELGRIHTWEAFLEGYELARSAGFANINVDLMSALPGQTVASWQEVLHRVIGLAPEHISAYSLIIEEGTPFYKKYGEDRTGLPGEEAERQMYYDTKEILQAAGYERYEISNYARAGYACRHNIGYWQRKEYRGFGLGAASLIGETRFRNTVQMDAYLAGDFARYEEEVLNQKAQMEEMMFLGLRMCQGVRVDEFAERFGIAFETVYGKVYQRLEQEKLLSHQGECICLTEKGVDLSNYVLSEFLL